MKELRWTNEAIAGLVALANRERRILSDILALVVEFPATYPARQRGKFAGFRYFVLGKRWIVYYRAGEKDVMVLAIVPALSRPR